MLRLVRLVTAWRFCKPRLAVSNRGIFSFSSHLFNTKNEIKPNSLLLFNNNVLCRGLAKWSKYDPYLLNYSIKNLKSIEEILAMFEKEGSNYDYVNLVNSLYKISKMAKSRGITKKKDQARVKVLERAAFGKINEMDARGLSNYIYSLVDLNFIKIEKEALESINQNLISKAKDFNTQDISNTVYALGKLGNRNEEVFKAISHKLKLTNLEGFTNQNICSTLYGLALVDLDNKNISKDIFASFSKEILNRDLTSFNSQEISNIVWSFATLKIKDEKLFESFAKHIVTRDLNEIKPQGICSTLYAYALAKLDNKINKPLFDAFSKHILEERDLNSLSDKEISTIIKCFATLEIKDEKLFELLRKHKGIRDANEFSPQDSSKNNKTSQELTEWNKSSLVQRVFLNDSIKDLKSIEEILAMFEKEGSKYDYQNLVNSLHKISKFVKRREKINLEDQARVKVLERAAFGKINEMRARELSKYIYSLVNFTFITIEKEKWEMINRNLIKKAIYFDQQNISNAVYALSKLGNGNEEVFEAISSKIKTTNIEDFTNQNISNTLYGFALADLDDKNISKYIFASLSKEILNRDLISFTVQEISKIIWAFVSLQIKNENLLESFAKHIVTRDLKELNDQGISNILYAYALAKLDDELNKTLFDAFSKHLVKIDIKFYKPQHISNILYAYALTSRGDDEMKHNIFKAFSQNLRGRYFKDFQPEHISKTLYAYAITNPDKVLFRIFSRYIVKSDLKDFQAENISNIIYACALSNLEGETNKDLFNVFSKHLITMDLREFDSQGISNILYAYAHVQQQAWEFDKNLFDAFSKNIIGERNLSSFDSKALKDIVWSFATLEIKDEKLFESLAKHMVTRDLSEFNYLEISNITWAYSKADHKDESLFQTFVDSFIKIKGTKDFNSQAIMNTLYAFSNFDLFPLILPHCREMLQNLKSKDKPLLLQEQQQLSQILAELNYTCGEEGKEIANDYDLNSLITIDLVKYHKKEYKSSSFHKEVSQILQKNFNLEIKNEYEAIKGFFVDIYIPNLNGEKVIISVDGPSHYHNETSKIETHNSKTTKRLLTKAGFKVLSLPYFEWRGKTTDEKVDTMKNLFL